VFEGWDAAGKGSAIRRVTEAVDARLFRVVPVAAPTQEELAQHYLWRFWRHLPRAGLVTIFDRSWYGRVLVERVEGLASREAWSRAYHEINEFENQLTDHGMVLLKFWIHISPEEQLERFRKREEITHKTYKITPDDWRNRRRWAAYELAVHDLVTRTSTSTAPWTLVAGNDKRSARIEILRTFCQALDRAL
jgi:AMP-polyphosphate phosphotransferase